MVRHRARVLGLSGDGRAGVNGEMFPPPSMTDGPVTAVKPKRGGDRSPPGAGERADAGTDGYPCEGAGGGVGDGLTGRLKTLPPPGAILL